MSTASNILDLLMLAAGFLVWGAIACAPRMLGSLSRRYYAESEADLLQQAEIARKVAIAEAAAAAARARGETFVPPADYDR